MQRILFASILATMAMAALPQPALANPGSPLCLPGAYSGVDCMDAGPAAYISRMERLGIVFPYQAFQAGKADSQLTQLPYAYAEITADQGRIFASLEAAIAGKPVARYIQPGFAYVSYVDVQVIDGKKYYMIAPGEWMKAGDLAANAVYSQFMGFTFTATPSRPFGWILQAIETRRTPGTGAPFSGVSFNRFDQIEVFETQEADGLSWYLVGPDMWIESSEAALVFPRTEAPNGVDNGRWIEIDLDQQTVSAYDNGQMVYATLTSTGVPGFWTRPGLFQIFEKTETTPMSGAFEADASDYYYLEDVPWTMYFDEARALHGAYWHTKFGYEQSHGCVNLSAGDSRWLFDWAQMGDWVYVWDASGETPEDPSLYGSGGA